MVNFSLYNAFSTFWRNILLELESYATKKELTDNSITPITNEEIDEICEASIYAVEEVEF